MRAHPSPWAGPGRAPTSAVLRRRLWIRSGLLWQSAPPVEEIFQRKRRRPSFARIGGVFFAVLALASLIDAIRAAPLPFGASDLEAAIYRLAAALFCGLLAIWLLLPARDERDTDRLLR